MQPHTQAPEADGAPGTHLAAVDPSDLHVRAHGDTVRGVPAAQLEEADLLRELEALHRTRHDTLLHGSSDALTAHNARMAELEGEYLRRHPRRRVVAGRTRAGARARSGQA